MSFPAELGRTVVLALSTIVGAFVSVSPAVAQKYPHQVVKIIVPTAAGGAVDAFGRGIGRKFEQSLGITAVVENKAGANGIIGAEAVAKSPPDGSTLLVVFPSHVINPLFTKTVPYDPLNDFSPIVRIGNIPLILVTHPSIPVKSVQELIALAKSKPGDADLSRPAASGRAGIFPASCSNFMTGTDIVHIVLQGECSRAQRRARRSCVHDVRHDHNRPYSRAQGRLSMLAVTSASRSPLAPDTPTMIEAGLSGFETAPGMRCWRRRRRRPTSSAGSMPSQQGVQRPAFREPFVEQGVQFVGGSPAEADAFLRSGSEAMGRGHRIERG